MSKTYLEIEEVERLEEAAEYLRDKLLIRLLFRLGCRVSEALGIAVSDIDFKRGLVTIQHLKVRLKLACPDCGGRLSKSSRYCPVCGVKVEQTVASEKEHRRLRVLPVDSETMKLLQEYVQRGGAVNRHDHELVFGINRHRAWQIVKECA
ncbi:tyrosine-type recombinase/integrase, partial [Chloroflexota bacterium]